MQKTYRLLVVEDEISIREPLTEFLHANKFDVDTAENGIEALNQLREKAYDLICLDLKMPYIDGHQLTQLMRDENIHIPILVLSAIDSLEPVFQEMGRIPKPYNLKEVVRMIRDFFNKKII